jgi:hypothetical protein
MLDVNGQSIGDGTLELVKFAETASAVNEITVTNSATGNAPEIAASGDDTNIDLKLTPKGTGKLNLDGIKFPNADGTANQVLKTDGSGNLSFTTLTSDGTADWDTSVKTTGFTATANKGYFCNTTSAAFTVTLPATPSAGDEVIILDYAGTADTNQIIINPNGNKIEGATANLSLTGEREGVRLVYIDVTQGWLAYSGINEGTDALAPVSYSVDFLVIAGGGGGGSLGGGGGAGGYRTSTQSVTQGTVITVTVGDGGAGSTGEYNSGTAADGSTGSDSSISGSGLTTITSAGGGGAGGHVRNGKNGGSGGGGGSETGVGGTGNTPSTSPSQGNNGGNGIVASPYYGAGGGGGSSAVGSNGTGLAGGNGGAGTASSITGSSVTRAGGGGGCTNGGGTGGTGSAGGSNGTTTSGANASAATANTGSGGGGGGYTGVPSSLGGSGGKGVVILSMPTASYSGTSTGSPTVTTKNAGADTVLQFNGSGSYTA